MPPPRAQVAEANANAFERLIDRAVFAEDSSGDESLESSSWQLLRSLLSQSAQARVYAKQVVLQYLSEHVDSGGGVALVARPRLYRLVLLWPDSERADLLFSIGVANSGASEDIRSIPFAASASQLVPHDHAASTPTWGENIDLAVNGCCSYSPVASVASPKDGVNLQEPLIKQSSSSSPVPAAFANGSGCNQSCLLMDCGPSTNSTESTSETSPTAGVTACSRFGAGGMASAAVSFPSPLQTAPGTVIGRRGPRLRSVSRGLGRVTSASSTARAVLIGEDYKEKCLEDLESIRNLALLARRAFARRVCRLVYIVGEYMLARRCAIHHWQCLASHLRGRQVANLQAMMLQASACAFRRRSPFVSFRMWAVALFFRNQRWRSRQLALLLNELHSFYRLRLGFSRLEGGLRRRVLLSAVRVWVLACRNQRLCIITLNVSLRVLHEMGVAVWMARRRQELGFCRYVLLRCALFVKKNSALEVASAIGLLAALNRCSLRYSRAGFDALRARAVRWRVTAKSKLAAIKALTCHLEACVMRQTSGALMVFRFFVQPPNSASVTPFLVVARLAALTTNRQKLRRFFLAWYRHITRPRLLIRTLRRKVAKLQAWSWRCLRWHAAHKGYQQYAMVKLAARIATLEQHPDPEVETTRLEFNSVLDAAREQEVAARTRQVVAQARTSDILFGRCESRAAYATWGAWRLWLRRVALLRHIGGSLMKLGLRVGLGSLRRQADRSMRARLEVQLDCFGAFVSKRSSACWRLVEICGVQRRVAERDAFLLQLRSALSVWHKFACLAKLHDTRKRYATRLFAVVLVRSLRRCAWHSWCAAVAMQGRAVELAHWNAAEVFLRKQIGEAVVESQVAWIQADARCKSLEGEVGSRNMECERLEAGIQVAQVTRTGLWWRRSAYRLSHTLSKRFIWCLSQAGTAARADRLVSMSWHRWVRTLLASRIQSTQASLLLAGLHHRYSKAALLMAQHDTICAQREVARLIYDNYTLWRSFFFQQLSRSARKLAACRYRLNLLARCLTVAALRSGFQELCGASWEAARAARCVTWREARAVDDKTMGACLFHRWLSSFNRSLQFVAFGRLRRAATAHDAAKLKAGLLLRRVYLSLFCPLRNAVHRRLACAFEHWMGIDAFLLRDKERVFSHERFLVSRSAVAALPEYGQGGHRCVCRTLRAWSGLARGPRRLVSSLRRAQYRRMLCAYQRLEVHAANSSYAFLMSGAVGSCHRQRRHVRIREAVTNWHQDLFRRRQFRSGTASLSRRRDLLLLRTSVAAFRRWMSRLRAVKRLGATLRRRMGCEAHVVWSTTAARMRVSEALAAQKASELCSMQQYFRNQELLEQWFCKFGRRSVRAVMHAWRCSCAVAATTKNEIVETRRLAYRVGARRLAGAIDAVLRLRVSAGFECWVRRISCCRAQDNITAAERQQRRAETLERVRAGGASLTSFLRRRRILSLGRAFRGPLQDVGRFGLVRAMDACGIRQHQRRTRELDTAEERLEELKVERASLEKRCHRTALLNKEASAEADRIFAAMRQEFRCREDILVAARNELQESLVAEGNATELASASRLRIEGEVIRLHRHFLEEVASANQARCEVDARNALLDAESGRLLLQLEATRGEVDQARRVAEERHACRAQLERSLVHEAATLRGRAQLLQEKLCTTQHEAQARARQLLHAIEERALRAEQNLALACAEQDDALHLQASIMEEQARSIHRLDDLLREQGDQLRRERLDNSRDLDSLRNSASLTESKSCLLQEQVAALRRQLKSQRTELKASEQTQAADRAALLAVVAPLPFAHIPPHGASTL